MIFIQFINNRTTTHSFSVWCMHFAVFVSLCKTKSFWLNICHRDVNRYVNYIVFCFCFSLLFLSAVCSCLFLSVFYPVYSNSLHNFLAFRNSSLEVFCRNTVLRVFVRFTRDTCSRIHQFPISPKVGLWYFIRNFLIFIAAVSQNTSEQLFESFVSRIFVIAPWTNLPAPIKIIYWLESYCQLFEYGLI